MKNFPGVKFSQLLYHHLILFTKMFPKHVILQTFGNLQESKLFKTSF